MAESKPKRSYRSTLRQEQARQTRLQIITAARKLFIAQGYTSTTIEAIALEAGVSSETIYATFGSKLNLLVSLVDYSVVGDDAPVPLLQRENIRSARQVTDPKQLILKFATDIYEIMDRMSPIFILLRATEKTDPDIAVLLQRLLKERMDGMRFFIQQLDRVGPLREGMNPDMAAETVWAISSGEVFHLMTVDRGWSRQQYIQWLADILTRTLL